MNCKQISTQSDSRVALANRSFPYQSPPTDKDCIPDVYQVQKSAYCAREQRDSNTVDPYLGNEMLEGFISCRNNSSQRADTHISQGMTGFVADGGQ